MNAATAPGCPRCHHNADEHWPEHGRRETACVMCLDYAQRTTEVDGSLLGICCHTAESIRSA